MATTLAAVSDDGVGARLRVRLLCEGHIGMMALLLRSFGGSVERGVIFLILLQQTLGDEDDAAPPRPVSINGIAQSLQRPFETVRRRVGELHRLGLCQRLPEGLVLDRSVLAAPHIQAFLDEFDDVVVRLIEDLARLRHLFPATATTALNQRAITATGIELVLAGFEFSAERYGDWTKMLLFVAVVTANARGFVYDDVLAHLYSDNDTPPPRSLRRPITARSLALAMHLPYATARRHIDQILAEGRFERVPGGLLVTDRTLVDPAFLESSVMLSQRLAVALTRLGQRGFPFADPASAYRSARPPLVEFLEPTRRRAFA